MSTLAIFGFFALVLVFFFTGKNDFGLKPTPKKEKLTESVPSKQTLDEEEIKAEI